MPFNATVIRVMIASPGDVASEREIIRNTIHEWNSIHSFDRKIVLLPVGWETHSTPEMGDRAQAIINNQILKDCDLLVAVFWTRLGSPTGKADSGTVEEIEEHIAANKPAMLYFSDSPIIPSNINADQYRSLNEFRNHCMERGLTEKYDSITQFRDLFTRQLAQKVIQHFSDMASKMNATIAASNPARKQLSEQAMLLLTEASKDRRGVVMCLRVMAGLIVSTNRRDFCETGSPRSEAIWVGAINELISEGLLEPRGNKNEAYGVTASGYKFVDQLSDGALP